MAVLEKQISNGVYEKSLSEQKFEWTKVWVHKYFAQMIVLFPLMKILFDEWWGTRQ